MIIMTSHAHFTQASVDFLRELGENNNRDWFAANKARAEEVLLTPGRELVVAVGERLRQKRPHIIADPRTDRSIYRLNRDTRFSRDKTPYKTHLALWWWEGSEGRLECPGFYGHLTASSWLWSVGCYRFSDAGLAGWREALLDPDKAREFQALIKAGSKSGWALSEPELKRTPAGLAADHPQALWLRHKGFYTMAEENPIPPELFGPGAADFICSRFASGFKLHGWLVRALQGA